ncbi:MAG TPA: nitroreductase family protein, partial [Candidatus Goldiibacteriota bacterium]|nr:nitroreductase family protein [Candidatus Goldiibacteriota bacterium]
IKFNETPKEALKELGAYSIIKGAKLFIAGIVKKQGRYLEDYGYCMEKNILKAAGLGLATCWLGATFNRGGFSENMRAGDGEVVPAVTPVGYAAEKRRLAENVMRAAIGADSRKPVEEIYFAGSFGNPARPQDVIKEAMNCVRLAPSASNKQPWRVLDETRRQSGAAEVRFLHFFLERDKGYIYPEGQNIDMGIAMCHFEYACLELGAGGRWVVEKPSCDPGGREYIASWFFL